MPYPPPSLEIKAMKDLYDSKYGPGMGWKFTSEIPAVRTGAEGQLAEAMAPLMEAGVCPESRDGGKIGIAMGCDSGTFSGLAGIGDLIVTATSVHSRNNRCGNLIGQGMTPDQAVKKVGMVVEGINAIPAALELQKKYDVEIPSSPRND